MSALSKDNYIPKSGLAVLRDIVAPEVAKPVGRRSSHRNKADETHIIRVVFKEAKEMMDIG